MGSGILTLAVHATPPVTLTQPVLKSHYQATTKTAVTYIVNNYVPKILSVSSISGIAPPISVASNGCLTIPSGSLDHPGKCSITLNITPTQSEANTTISQVLQINYGGRTPLKSNINFSVLNAAPIVFLSKTLTFGDMSAANSGHIGLQGADDLCNQDAQTYGTPAVKSHPNYKALLIASNRTPCSKVNGANGCGGIYQNGWILAANATYYTPAGNTVFAVTTSNAIFPDDGPPTLYFPDDTIAQINFYNTFWMGAQSVLVNSANTSIIGWAAGNLTEGDSSDDYSLYFALCTPTDAPAAGLEWTSQSSYGAVGFNNDISFSSHGTYPLAPQWTNYFAWQNNSANYPKDQWSTSNRYACNYSFPIVCVSQ